MTQEISHAALRGSRPRGRDRVGRADMHPDASSRNPNRRSSSIARSNSRVSGRRPLARRERGPATGSRSPHRRRHDSRSPRGAACRRAPSRSRRVPHNRRWSRSGRAEASASIWSGWNAVRAVRDGLHPVDPQRVELTWKKGAVRAAAAPWRRRRRCRARPPLVRMAILGAGALQVLLDLVGEVVDVDHGVSTRPREAIEHVVDQRFRHRHQRLGIESVRGACACHTGRQDHGLRGMALRRTFGI